MLNERMGSEKIEASTAQRKGLGGRRGEEGNAMGRRAIPGRGELEWQEAGVMEALGCMARGPFHDRIVRGVPGEAAMLVCESVSSSLNALK